MPQTDIEKRREYNRKYYETNKLKNKCEHNKQKADVKNVADVAFVSIVELKANVKNVVEVAFVNIIELKAHVKNVVD